MVNGVEQDHHELIDREGTAAELVFVKQRLDIALLRSQVVKQILPLCHIVHLSARSGIPP